MEDELINYIVENLKKGYSKEYLKNYLISQGHDQKNIDDSISRAIIIISGTNFSATNANVWPKKINEPNADKKKKKIIIFLFISLFLLFILIAFTYFFGFIKEDNNPGININISLSKNSFFPGEWLDVTRTVSRLDDVKLKNIELNDSEIIYIILKDDNNKKGNEVFRSIETASFDKTGKARILLPLNLTPGKYLLIASSYFGSKKSEFSIDFKILEKNSIKKSCFDGIKNQNEIDIDCGGVCESCATCPNSCEKKLCMKSFCSKNSGFVCYYQKIAPCCGNEICEIREDESSCPIDCTSTNSDDLNEIKNMQDDKLIIIDSKTAKLACTKNPNEDDKDTCLTINSEKFFDPILCEEIFNGFKKDECFNRISQLTKNNIICDSITNIDKRDTCYSAFFLEKDFSICDKIVNIQLKNSCTKLKSLQDKQ